MPREFSEWEWDKEPDQRTAEESEAAFKAMQAAVAAREEVRAWAQATAPVAYHRDWWRAVVRPVLPAHDAGHEPNPVPVKPQWEGFVGYHADSKGVPYPADWMPGDYLGTFDGQEPPSEEAVAKAVAAWMEACE